ncbi:hypothetical protein BpHYR1_005998 [Brachionus plicatilis]|uniref:Secreted protein n=1 Tax=Brachionus plicatilis TaxID=10195 RepID=A0A3M7SWG1_BRAPC|nr:hypothetical protein BpHYR1_005998 [Brachionus plicatilis]
MHVNLVLFQIVLVAELLLTQVTGRVGRGARLGTLGRRLQAHAQVLVEEGVVKVGGRKVGAVAVALRYRLIQCGHGQMLGMVLDELVGDCGRVQRRLRGRLRRLARCVARQIVFELNAVLVEQVRLEKVLVAHFFLADGAEGLELVGAQVALGLRRLAHQMI